MPVSTVEILSELGSQEENWSKRPNLKSTRLQGPLKATNKKGVYMYAGLVFSRPDISAKPTENDHSWITAVSPNGK